MTPTMAPYVPLDHYSLRKTHAAFFEIVDLHLFLTYKPLYFPA